MQQRGQIAREHHEIKRQAVLFRFHPVRRIPIRELFHPRAVVRQRAGVPFDEQQKFAACVLHARNAVCVPLPRLLVTRERQGAFNQPCLCME